MKVNRQQVLLGVLILMAVLRVGDFVLSSMIQGPLQELRGDNSELQETIEKQEKLLAEARTAGQQIEAWQQRSLPFDTETARSLYRNWLLDIVRQARLRSATVDSGTPANRYGLYRAMPFNVQARGTLREITSALFQFESAGLLHRIVNLRITPVAQSGQFDLALGVEGLMLPQTQRTSLPKGKSQLLASTQERDYEVIARDNLFGIGINHQDPMSLTILSGITYRNAQPTAWITEQITDSVHQVSAGDEFQTDALHGQILHVDEKSITFKSGEFLYTMQIGHSFAEARPLEPEAAVARETLSSEG
ncbi:MAG: hypothetical protein R3C59_13065 [Planctomycetaceae bacterium]